MVFNPPDEPTSASFFKALFCEASQGAVSIVDLQWEGLLVDTSPIERWNND